MRLLSFIFLLSLQTGATAQVINVYTTEAGYTTQIDGVEVVYHKVDQILDMENELSEGLPNNEEQALEVARQRINPQIEKDMVAAWQTVTKVQLLNIEYLPAIVFDDKYVYYGHDLRRAKNLFDRYMAEQQ